MSYMYVCFTRELLHIKTNTQDYFKIYLYIYVLCRMGQFSFYLLVPRHTPAYSLLANAALCCRFGPPLAFNFMAAIAMPPSPAHSWRVSKGLDPNTAVHFQPLQHCPALECNSVNVLPLHNPSGRAFSICKVVQPSKRNFGHSTEQNVGLVQLLVS